MHSPERGQRPNNTQRIFFQQMTMMMTSIDLLDYVLYLEEWRVLVCLNEKCRCGMAPDYITRHLQSHHKESYDLNIRQQIERHSRTLNLSSPSQITIPRNRPVPIDGLKIWNGWRCKACSKVGPLMEGAIEHCRKEHSWRASQ